MKRKTILLDFDGTLLRQVTYPPQTEALWGSVEISCKIPHGALAAVPIDRLGKTDYGVASELAASQGSWLDAGWWDLYAVLFENQCPLNLVEEVRPGVVPLLAWLSITGGVDLRLATGNHQPVAELKAHRSGLSPWLDLQHSGYGATDDRRDALRMALEDTGDVIYVCDTARDVAAAHVLGIEALALVTEEQTAEQLAEADHVAANVQGLRGVLAAWMEK